MKFYISDLHFDHSNCLSLDNRPFLNIEELNSKLISNWNNVVGPGDEVFILGDFCWKKEDRWAEILPRLNGQKTLILGNHDITPSAKTRRYFADVKEYKVVDDNGRKVVLCHYPIPCYRNHFYGWYHLYGHVHSSFEWNMMEHDRYIMEQLYTRPCEMYNVGCMLPYMNYTPRTLDEIIKGYNEYRELSSESNTSELSTFELQLLMRLDKMGLKWLARDENGYLQAFRLEPFMWSPEDQYFEMPSELIEEPEIDKDFLPLSFVKDCFSMIKNKDKCKIHHLICRRGL